MNITDADQAYVCVHSVSFCCCPQQTFLLEFVSQSRSQNINSFATMLSKHLINVLLLTCILVSVSCDSDDGLDKSSQDYIEIISVNPSTNLVDGEEYTFQIEIEYNLVSFDQALVSVAFNADHIHSYRFDLSSLIEVEAGQGTRIIESTSVTKDWKNEGDFWVLVTMFESVIVEDEENPRDPQELGTDQYILVFK